MKGGEFMKIEFEKEEIVRNQEERQRLDEIVKEAY